MEMGNEEGPVQGFLPAGQYRSVPVEHRAAEHERVLHRTASLPRHVVVGCGLAAALAHEVFSRGSGLTAPLFLGPPMGVCAHLVSSLVTPLVATCLPLLRFWYLSG